MEQVLTWSEFAQDGPPPEWPGCPAKPVLELTTSILGGEAAEWKTQGVNTPESPIQDRPGSDPYILKRLTHAHTECEHLTSTLNDNPDAFNPARDIRATVEALSDLMGKDLIPLVIIPPHSRRVVYAALSRDPRWAGMSPSLPLLQGLDAVISTFRHHRPMLIGAITSSEYTQQFPTRPEYQAKNRKNVRGTQSLISVLEYHGATPRFRYQQQHSEITLMPDFIPT